jgi:outer membrane protein assembly factor BamD
MRHSIPRNLSLLGLAVAMCVGLSGCLFWHHAKPEPLAGMKAAPDKVLFDQATSDIKRGHYTVARLTLQTLINTYPDSEYLAKAKLAIADSFYGEGGVSGLTQSVAEYKDFITFFPFLDEAAYAQYRVAMAHYRMMEKPDRDRTQALEAEAEFQTMLLKYPKSQWAADGEQRLREVQEVIAVGEFDTAQFYDLRKAYGAAGARLVQLTAQYPLFSQADEANWMLARIYERTEHIDSAARYYSTIVRDYPLSPLAAQAKSRLLALGVPVPQPDPKALARMKEEEGYPRQGLGLKGHAFGMLKSAPDVSHAAHYGDPNLSAETEVISARDVLSSPVAKTPGAAAVLSNSVSAETVGTGPAGTDSNPGPAPVADPTQRQMAAEARAMNDPTKGPKADETAPSADIAAKNQPAVSGKDLPKTSSKDISSSKKKKKKKGVHKLVPW